MEGEGSQEGRSLRRWATTQSCEWCAGQTCIAHELCYVSSPPVDHQPQPPNPFHSVSWASSLCPLLRPHSRPGRLPGFHFFGKSISSETQTEPAATELTERRVSKWRTGGRSQPASRSRLLLLCVSTGLWSLQSDNVSCQFHM